MTTVDFNDLIGKPFADLGRGPYAYDCWGVVLEVNRRLGRALIDYGACCHVWDPHGIMQSYFQAVGQFELVFDPIPGDVVVFRRIGRCLHFGVIVDKHHILHTCENTGIQKSCLYDPRMSKLVEKGFYRWIG